MRSARAVARRYCTAKPPGGSALPDPPEVEPVANDSEGIRGSRVHLSFHEGGTVAEVALVRGAKYNVMDDRFFAELRAAFDEASATDAVRVAVLRSEGKHFSAGLDLKAAAELFFKDAGGVQKAKLAASAALGLDSSVTEKGMPAMRNQRLHKMILSWQAAISSLQSCRVPVIAAIQGKCIGGAVDVVTAADIRLCTKDATFSIKEAEVGIVADLGTLQRVTGIVGQGIVRELAFTGDDFTAARAERIGFVNSVHDTEAELAAAARALAVRIAARSPLAVQGTKEILNFPVDPVVRAGLHNVALHNAAFLKSDDLLRAVMAFIRKQKPKFGDYVVPASKA
ncbi:Delta-3 [Diplonema papillatum]|nr:Delta-3 [Diplonema papillatum]